jgi:hypothetical protein
MTNKNILFHQNLFVLMLIYLFFNLYASCPICPIKREREREMLGRVSNQSFGFRPKSKQIKKIKFQIKIINWLGPNTMDNKQTLKGNKWKKAIANIFFNILPSSSSSIFLYFLVK